MSGFQAGLTKKYCVWALRILKFLTLCYNVSKLKVSLKPNLNGLFYGSSINTGNSGLTEYLPDRQEQMMRGRRMWTLSGSTNTFSVSSFLKSFFYLTWQEICAGRLRHNGDQVWSLTQFCSVDFSKSKIGLKKCVFNKRTIKVCVSCCWRCPGTSAPSAAHLTVSLYLCSSGSNARGESRAREGRRVSSKNP